MTFLAPLWLALAAAAAAGVVALHFITTARAPQAPLPTARFVPAGTASAAARSARPADLVLLALRVLAVLLLGAAFAKPEWRASGARLRRVVVADVSRGAGADVRDSVRLALRDGDALVLVDSAAREVAFDSSLREVTTRGARGALSAGFAAAMPVARRLARSADSVELVIVSPFTRDALDSATATFARAWPGRLRLVRTRAAESVSPSIVVEPSAGDDPLVAAAALLGANTPRAAREAPVRLLRATITARDSLAAREGAAVVLWPRTYAGAATARGVTDGRATVVALLGAMPLADGGTVIARWADGTPAATEQALAKGCVRSVGIGVPLAGDAALQSDFLALARTVLGPCLAQGAWPAAGDDLLNTLRRDGAAAPASALRAGDDASPIVPWLLLLALALLTAETWARRTREAAP